jgi:GNAT superfamily N-acetyltransferase
MLQLRTLKSTDPPMISAAFTAQGWNKPITQYEEYLRLQREEIRDVIVATWDTEFAGYLTVLWESHYAYFKGRQIPEVVDFNVLQRFQRRGIGTALMDEAERRIRQHSGMAGIGVGITADYGPAQILYARRGYVSLGHGLTRSGRVLRYGESTAIDDDLVIHLQKLL